MILSNVVDGHRGSVFLTSCRSDYLIGKHLSQIVNGESFSERVSALFSDSRGLNLVSNNPFSLIFKVLKSSHLLKNALLVLGRSFAGHYLYNFVKVMNSSLLGKLFVLRLANKMRNEVHSEAEILVRSQNAHIHKHDKVVALESSEEVLHENSRHHLLLSSFCLLFLCSDLQISAIYFVVSTQISSLLPLSFE